MVGAKPIIVVPASYMQGNLALGNAKAFLQEAQYKTPEEVPQVDIMHRIGEEQVYFEVVNSVLGFSEA